MLTFITMRCSHIPEPSRLQPRKYKEVTLGHLAKTLGFIKCRRLWRIVRYQMNLTYIPIALQNRLQQHLPYHNPYAPSSREPWRFSTIPLQYFQNSCLIDIPAQHITSSPATPFIFSLSLLKNPFVIICRLGISIPAAA